MKAAVLESAEAIPRYADFENPVASEHRQLMSLVAAGIHPVTRAIATGAHYGSDHRWPLIPGVDAVARTDDGTLVYTGWPEHPFGTFAELMATPMGTPLPEGADPVQVAGGLNPGLSSWLPLLARQKSGPLGTVLVVGATGVAGQLAVQNALALGADHVIAIGRNESALASLSGANRTTVALVDDADAAEANAENIRAAIEANRPSTILDFVWGPPAEAVFTALTRSGLDEDDHPVSYIEIGESAGPGAVVRATLLRSTSITISGSGAGSGDVRQIMQQLPIYMQRIADGTVTIPVTPYPLAEVATAWQDLTPGRRVVVTA
jgi:NADPH:quinone reductase-like Zn-dependent oxidoreductase